MKLIIAISLIICSIASAEPWIGKSTALDKMENYLADYDNISIIGMDTIEENNIMLVYPYGYGCPKYVGYIKMASDSASKIVAISIDAITGDLLSKGVDRKGSLYPDMIADSALYYGIIMNFLDTNFVKEEAEKMTEKRVRMMHFMSCGGVYGYLDCLDTAPYFWVIHFKDGEEYIFYYAGSWKLFPASDLIKNNIENNF